MSAVEFEAGQVWTHKGGHLSFEIVGPSGDEDQPWVVTFQNGAPSPAKLDHLDVSDFEVSYKDSVTCPACGNVTRLKNMADYICRKCRYGHE